MADGVRVTMRLPAVLRPDAGGAAAIAVELPAGPEGATIDEVLVSLTASHPRLARRIADERGELRRYVNVFVDGEDCRRLAGRATPVRDGSVLEVLPSVAGGAPVTAIEGVRHHW